MNILLHSVRRQMHGFTLIEAMVAAALLGLGILGTVTLTMYSLNAAGSSRQQNTALTLAHNSIDCFRSGSILCPASAALTSTGQMQETQTLSGTVYQVSSQVSPTSVVNLRELQVIVSWQPTGSPNNLTDNPMSQGAGKIILKTRVASTPIFWPLPTP